MLYTDIFTEAVFFTDTVNVFLEYVLYFLLLLCILTCML